MLIVVEANGVQETTEIVNLLLLNKKKSFHIYEDESELFDKLQSAASKLAKNDEDVEKKDDNADQFKILDNVIIEEPCDEPKNSPISKNLEPKEQITPLNTSLGVEPVLTQKLCWNFNLHSEPLPPDAVDDCETFYMGEKSDNDEDEPVSRMKIGPPLESPSVLKPPTNNKINCTKCKYALKGNFLSRQQLAMHSLLHSNLMRFKCPMEGCPKKSRQKVTIIEHLQRVHSTDPSQIKIPECLTSDDWKFLNELSEECFPTTSRPTY